MPDNWRPIDDAPKDGRTLEALSLDYGKGPSTTVYRVRWFQGGWFNAAEPCEELLYLTGWREAEPRGGLAQLFDALPINKLANRKPRGMMLDMFGQIGFLLATGHDHLAKEAIDHLARGVADA